MGISDFQPIVKSVERLVNLVTIDAINTDLSTVREDADPLKKIIVYSLTQPIPKDLHSNLRKLLKSHLWTDQTASGKIQFSPRTLEVTVYLKGLRKPAWSPDDG